MADANKSGSQLPIRTSDLQEEFQRQGFVSLGAVIDPVEIEPLRARLEASVLAHSYCEPPAGYVPGFLRFDQSIAPYLAHERVLGFAQSFFGPHTRISMLSGMVNAPGFPRGDFHADWPYNQELAARIPAPYPDHVFHIVTMWMLTNFTEENGATIVVPASHHEPSHPRSGGPIDPLAPHPREVRLLGEAGTVAAFDARLWHAAAANVSSHNRAAVLVRYAPWWLNLNTLVPGTSDYQNIVADSGKRDTVHSLPLSVFEKLPPDARALLQHAITPQE